jgi:HTH-type transcriptional regulator/antitoxin HigA
MEQEGLIQNDLVALFGNKSRVSEVLNKKRKLTLDMIRNLHQQLNIPFENLLGEYRLV